MDNYRSTNNNNNNSKTLEPDQIKKMLHSNSNGNNGSPRESAQPGTATPKDHTSSGGNLARAFSQTISRARGKVYLVICNFGFIFVDWIEQRTT